MIRFALCFFCLLYTQYSLSQTRYTVSGTVKDAATGETLIGASVKIKELQTGTSTNAYGFFSLSAPAGKYELVTSYLGYTTQSVTIVLVKDLRQNIELTAGGNELQEVTVSAASSGNENVSGVQMGVEKLNMSTINSVPVVMGEKDIVKTIQLLPGVKTFGEANTGFYVRGGGADQNLILLDEATVYNASHLFGFFSTFNSDAIKDASLYKGGMPAQFGGRLSSVLDIKMNDGNNKQFGVEGGIGLIASRIKVEGPVVKNKGSFMVSARRTYADMFLGLSADTTVRGASLYFYDINAKLNYQFNEKNTVYLSGYFGRDVLGLRRLFSTDWGNVTGTFRWNHLFSNRLFLNSSVIYTNYNYVVESLSNSNDFRSTSTIRDVNLKEDFQYFINNRHSLRFGLNAIHHTILPGSISTSQTSSFNSKTIESRYGMENALYISDDWHISSKLNVMYGLRASWFALLGPGTFNTYNEDGDVQSAKHYGGGRTVANYVSLEPRLSAAYTFNDRNSIKASYNRNTQNIHLLSNSTTGSPMDAYIMSSNNVKPEIADQLALGYYRNFRDNVFEFSAEVYYKWLQNQIDYRDGAQLIANENVESQLLYGLGRAYGLELFLKKKYGNFNGWLGYTLSRTERKFDAISNGNYFPARQDRLHDITAVGIYKLNNRWTFSGTFVYGTGNAVTFPAGKYQVAGMTTFYYTERNGYRMPASHRLDLGATLEGKPGKKFRSSWTFSVYNVYSHKNPYTITFQDKENDPTRTEAVQTSLFGAVPSVSWNFKF
ncbi:TonB-dependent receptor [Pedobacter sp. BS3]|uniref:TonB-dependent receptor n=1 Tax=Pedobacter sp. BS3 TaxID=2567937 RepID=UPI0011EFED50|nr:TonB-dependent receptor [Pedobacter sp. BS3]TZF83751.1 TonB-dependent receptor [Pedobacter sp. BS3]